LMYVYMSRTDRVEGPYLAARQRQLRKPPATMRSIVLACLAVGSDAFMAPHRLGVKRGSSSIELGSVAEREAPTMSEGPPMGQHGTGSKFMPLTQLDSEEYAPRTVQVAGVLPGLTKEEFYAPQSAPAAPPGQWQFDFSDPEGPQVPTARTQPCNWLRSK